jgi:hypothetical protein
MATDEVDNRLSGDLLEGGAAIAEFLFGSPDERARVYHLVSIGEIPCFQLGTLLFARKTTLLAHIGQREQKTLSRTT